MARCQQYVDGYRRGSKDAVEWLHNRAKQMGDPQAKAILDVAAWSMGNDLCKSAPEVQTKEKS